MNHIRKLQHGCDKGISGSRLCTFGAEFLLPQGIGMDKERRYIRKRKLIALGNSICFYLCRIFTVKNNRISVCTFEGKGGFGCNPKYVVLELHKQRPDLEIVWIVNDMSKEFPEYIKKVPNTLWSRAYWLSTSKVWIDNYRKPYGNLIH